MIGRRCLDMFKKVLSILMLSVLLTTVSASAEEIQLSDSKVTPLFAPKEPPIGG
jgi:hypothetical protein